MNLAHRTLLAALVLSAAIARAEGVSIDSLSRTAPAGVRVEQVYRFGATDEVVGLAPTAKHAAEMLRLLSAKPGYYSVKLAWMRAVAKEEDPGQPLRFKIVMFRAS